MKRRKSSEIVQCVVACLILILSLSCVLDTSEVDLTSSPINPGPMYEDEPCTDIVEFRYDNELSCIHKGEYEVVGCLDIPSISTPDQSACLIDEDGDGVVFPPYYTRVIGRLLSNGYNKCNNGDMGTSVAMAYCEDTGAVIQELNEAGDAE